MAKFNVGVGDAFPVDTEAAQPRDIEDRVERDDVDDGDRYGRRRYRRRHRFWFIRVALICLVVYGALAAFSTHAPKGLLLAAMIVFGIGVVSWMFSDSDRDRDRDRGRRRSWRDR